MSIDLGNSPTGTPPTLEEKAQIREALGLGNTITADGVAILTNKTLENANFTENVYGQFELQQQQLLSHKSALTSHGLFAQQNNIQRFNIFRPRLLKGGLNVDTLRSEANNSFVDNEDVVGYSTNQSTTPIDHTSFVTYRFGRPWMNTSSGGSMNLNQPYSFAMRTNHVLIKYNCPAIIHIGPMAAHQGGMPVGRGWGLCLSKEGYRLWSHNATSFAVTGVKDSATITSSTAHNFIDGDVVRFIGTLTSNNVTTGQTFNLVNSTAYHVVNATTNSFELSNTKGGTAITLNGNLTSGTIPALPTYSAPFAGGVPHIQNGYQSNSNFLFTTDGAGTGQVFYGPYNGPVGTTPLATITVPTTTGSIDAYMYMSFTSRESYIPGQTVDANGIPGTGAGFDNRQTISYVTALSFAPF